MNWKNIFAITKKDLLEVSQNTSAWTPMVILPVLFVVIFPIAMILIPTQFDSSLKSFNNQNDLATFLNQMPESMRAILVGLNETQAMITIILGMIFAPLFLVFPLMFSTIIAAESFAGERERKTLEALLYSPATDSELFLGKVLAALVPALTVSWGSFAVYTLVVNTVGFSVFGRIWFPLPTWYPLIFWITPALALLGISATVLISTRVKTFMGAYQTSSSLVIVVVGLMIGQISGVLYLSILTGMIIGLVIWIIAISLTYLAIKTFNRKALLLNS
jgi:ABC-type Na+ efflux pump permease subunit